MLAFWPGSMNQVALPSGVSGTSERRVRVGSEMDARNKG